MYIQVTKVQQGLVTNMTSVLNKISMGVSGIIMALQIKKVKLDSDVI